MVFRSLPNLINHSKRFPKMVVPESVHLRNICGNIGYMRVDHYRVSSSLNVTETILQGVEGWGKRSSTHGIIKDNGNKYESF